MLKYGKIFNNNLLNIIIKIIFKTQNGLIKTLLLLLMMMDI